MKIMLIIVAVLCVLAAITFFTRNEFPATDSGEYLPRDELIRLSEP